MKNFKEVEQHIIRILKTDLPDDLYYHGMHHTIDVLNASEFIGNKERISKNDMLLLKVAALYHDAGFTKTYQNHEEAGCKMAIADLPEFGFSQEEINIICGMIKATKIPQKPKTKLECILADADLEYLGTSDFKRIGDTLFDEMKKYMGVKTTREWNTIQLHFLETHKYHTAFCKKHRETEKQKHIIELKKSLKR